MAKKSTKSNLKVVGKVRSEEDQKKWRAEHEAWEKAEEALKIRPREIADRVRSLRAELEYYREQMEGVRFDIPSGDAQSPRCLVHGRRKEHAQLVEDLNPFVTGIFKMIDEYAKQHGCHEFLDFNAKLYTLNWQAAETGFQIGVLAGSIFAGCTKDEVDRLERGLVFSLRRNYWLC
jgi:hypothetical protein